jgi:hypothetical protein
MTETTVDLSALRTPFPAEYVGKLPRVTCPQCSKGQCGEHSKAKCAECGNYISTRHIHLDYVGHADVTIRLLDVDPEWTWAPKTTDPDPDMLKAAVASGDPEIVRMVIDNAPPKFETDRNGNPVGLWIRLTVGGVTRLGVGSCPSNQNDAEKVLIGDALRNAAMRFGVAVDLWAKGDRADPTAENATASAGKASRGGRRAAGDAFEDAAPARPRTAQQQASAPAAEIGEVDIDAQAFADEAHGAVVMHDIEDIHRRAREAEKLTALVRNPSSNGKGKPGKLALYLDWKRSQVKEADEALAELTAAGDLRDMDTMTLAAHVKDVTGADLEVATAAQMRQAAAALDPAGKAAA